jgi:cell wall-associated NlpC family hydrolase
MVATATVAVLPVGASRLTSERAQAQALADKISALGRQEAALGEQYNGGLIAFEQAQVRVAAAAKAVAAAKAGQERSLRLLEQVALEAYVGGGPQAVLAGPATLKNLDEALLRQEIEQTLASDQTDVMDQYRLAAAQAAAAHQQLVNARNLDAVQLARLENDRHQVQSAQDKVVATEDQVKGSIAKLVAQIQAQELAVQRAAAARLAAQRAAAAAVATAQAARQRALQAAPSPPQPGNTSTFQPPPESSGAAIAVAAAESRVGDPYVWGAAGPDAFDCSGLVMWAWAQAGVYLPHFSGAQYADTTHIPMSDLEPGDLVYPWDPDQHVAMYIGNGEIVQAPYTGADVQIVPLTSYFQLASRVG